MGWGVAVIVAVAVGNGVGGMGVAGWVDTAVAVGNTVAVGVNVGRDTCSTAGVIVAVGVMLVAC